MPFYYGPVFPAIYTIKPKQMKIAKAGDRGYTTKNFFYNKGGRMKQFQNEKDVWQWYQRGSRVLTQAYIDKIPWDQCNPALIRQQKSLPYFRDIEALTPIIYYPELTETPSSKDMYIAPFMQRWSEEEQTHGELLDRIITMSGGEAFHRSSNFSHPILTFCRRLLENGLGECYKALHMTWGAITELSTKFGYRVLSATSEDITLREILRGIVAEEAKHLVFYYNVASLKLARSRMAQMVTLFAIRRFWHPVGSKNTKPEDLKPVLGLISGENINLFHEEVTKIINTLPGLRRLNLTATVARYQRKVFFT